MEKEEIEKIIQIKGNVRGGVIQANVTFIQKKKGEEGLRAIEKKMAGLGYPIKFEEIKVGEWYPESLSVLTILVAKDLFNWGEKDIFEMGSSTPKYSFIAKTFMRYFLSLKRFVIEIPNYWKKHFDFGELEVSELNEFLYPPAPPPPLRPIVPPAAVCPFAVIEPFIVSVLSMFSFIAPPPTPPDVPPPPEPSVIGVSDEL